MTPESASIIHCHVVAETMIGSSHGHQEQRAQHGGQREVALEEHRQREPDRVLEEQRHHHEDDGVPNGRQELRRGR